jgi:hypothetical protein
MVVNSKVAERGAGVRPGSPPPRFFRLVGGNRRGLAGRLLLEQVEGGAFARAGLRDAGLGLALPFELLAPLLLGCCPALDFLLLALAFRRLGAQCFLLLSLELLGKNV